MDDTLLDLTVEERLQVARAVPIARQHLAVQHLVVLTNFQKFLCSYPRHWTTVQLSVVLASFQKCMCSSYAQGKATSTTEARVPSVTDKFWDTSSEAGTAPSTTGIASHEQKAKW